MLAGLVSRKKDPLLFNRSKGTTEWSAVKQVFRLRGSPPLMSAVLEVRGTSTAPRDGWGVVGNYGGKATLFWTDQIEGEPIGINGIEEVGWQARLESQLQGRDCRGAEASEAASATAAIAIRAGCLDDVLQLVIGAAANHPQQAVLRALLAMRTACGPRFRTRNDHVDSVLVVVRGVARSNAAPYV